MLVEAKEQIEKDMQKEDAKEEKKEEEDNKGGDLVDEGEKSRKESQPLIVRDAIVEVIVKMFSVFIFLLPPTQVQTEKEWEKLIHTEGLVIVDIYCAWCFSEIIFILFIVHGASQPSLSSSMQMQ